MRRIRATVRLVSVSLLTKFFFLIWAFGTALTFWSRPAKLSVRNFAFRSWASSILRVLNARVEVLGKLPEAPFFLVTNHLSYIDVLLLASRLDAAFVAKREVRSWPVMGILCRCVDTVFVDRDQRRDIPRALEQLDRARADGHGIVLFPEGTSTDGSQIRPFRPSLLEVAARSQIPVSYASLSYSTPDGEAPANLAVCWWGEMTFTDHFFRLLTLPSFTATLSFGEEPIRDTDRKRLAERLWIGVDQLFRSAATEKRACG
jgi:1-acyl-sn-glycerol-3-phosphate acyltransferase